MRRLSFCVSCAHEFKYVQLKGKCGGDECVNLMVYGHCSGWFIVWQYDIFL